MINKENDSFISNILYENSAINAIRTNGRSKNPEDVNVLEFFYEKYKCTPVVYKIISSEEIYFDWNKINIKIKELYPNQSICYREMNHDIRKNITYSKQDIIDFNNGVIGVFTGGSIDDYYLINYNTSDVKTILSDNIFLVKEKFEDFDKLTEIFKECLLEKTFSITIGMVSYDNGNFYVKDFDIKNKIFDIHNLDLHYGEGFQKFNDDLINRLNDETKGLTLFHGQAGTGKTTYVRHLLKKIKQLNKDNNVLYFPPTMVGSITDPGFINFISEWVIDTKAKNYLFIEDAEPLLESRDSSRNIGITNLLNLTDGLLNDILNIQVIATFNTSLKNIDDALLRPERLTARKEFKELNLESSKKLAEYLQIDQSKISKNMTLADIYSLKKNSKTILHDINNMNHGKLGFD